MPDGVTLRMPPEHVFLNQNLTFSKSYKAKAYFYTSLLKFIDSYLVFPPKDLPLHTIKRNMYRSIL